MGRLDGKVALVTGAAQGMGRGIALRLAEEGADVAINDVQPVERIQEVAKEIEALGRRSLSIQCDIADRDAVQQMVAQVADHFGHLDIAAANTGITVMESVVEAKWENVLHVLEVTQFGVFHTSQFAAQQMVKQFEAGREGGKIIITGSVHTLLAVPRSAAYNMAKAAVVQLAKTMAVELAQYRINVNVVNPGWVDTPNTRMYVGDGAVDEGGSKIPWGRLGRPEDIGKAVAYLASDDADYVTGEALLVDGGFRIGMRLPETATDFGTREL